MARFKLDPAPRGLPSIRGTNFLPSGGTLLDLVLGGGYAEGRIVNIVGDKSSGKTLLAIEAMANFAKYFPVKKKSRYAEGESAFDLPYATSIGMPNGVSISKTGEIETVEDFHADLGKFLEQQDGVDPCLYILDSLDSLSDAAEMESELGKSSYGTAKAKAMSKLFRQLTAEIRDKRCIVIIISQIRDKIGVTFGETKTRSGGRALDFYASQIIWLAEIKKLTRTVSGVKRVTGVQVHVRNKKNKVGPPFRDAEFSVQFGYGIDDERSMLDWIKANKCENELWAPYATIDRELQRARAEKKRAELNTLSQALRLVVQAHWQRIEDQLAPSMSKYG